MPNADQLTDSEESLTDEGKEANESGKDDATVAGLTRRLNREIEKRKAAEKLNAEAISKLGDEEERGTKLSRVEKENLALKVAMKYPKHAGALTKAFEKGILDPALVDDEFMEAFGPAAQVTEDEETESPAHNPQRGTSPKSAMDQLKNLTSLWTEE